jgi:phosphonate transport system substrate-binding protein
VCSVFAGPAEAGAASWQDAVELLLPGEVAGFEVLGFTEESPNDGLAVAMGSAPDLLQRLEQAFLQLHAGGPGQSLLEDIFNAERFEPAPRMGYRALYRVALSSL